MSVARFIADQRTFYAVPHAFSCRLLAVSESWFYKWIKAPTTVRGERRALLDEAVRRAFAASGATFGSPRVYEDLIDPELPHPELAAIQDDQVVTLPVPTACQDEAVCDPTDEVPDQAGGQVVSGEPEASGADPAQGSDPLLDSASGCSLSNSTLVWRVSVNTVADSMRRQGLRGRKVKRNRGLTRQDRTAAKFPDLLKRDFTAAAANLRWVGDMKCRRRHLMSYADLRTMPTFAPVVSVCLGIGAQTIGIVTRPRARPGCRAGACRSPA